MFFTYQNFQFWLDFFASGLWVEVGVGLGLEWRWVVDVNERPWLGCFPRPFSTFVIVFVA